MKSTGEVMGKDITLEKAVYKGLVASGMKIKEYGTVLLTVADKDKEEASELAKRFINIGYQFWQQVEQQILYRSKYSRRCC